jgi:hypothetical protein
LAMRHSCSLSESQSFQIFLGSARTCETTKSSLSPVSVPSTSPRFPWPDLGQLHPRSHGRPVPRAVLPRHGSLHVAERQLRVRLSEDGPQPRR